MKLCYKVILCTKKKKKKEEEGETCVLCKIMKT